MTRLDEYEFDIRGKLLFDIGLILLGIILALLFYRNIFFAPLVILLAPRLRQILKNEIIYRRTGQFMMQFKDFLFLASTAIGTGLGMRDAIRESIPGLREIYGDRAIFVRELNKCYQRMQVGCESDVVVLNELAANSGLADVVDFASVYAICKETGGNLVLALNKAANMIIDKMTVEKEVKEIVRRKKSEGYLILLMPIAIILFLNVTAPDYIAPMYETLIGRIIMTVAAASDILIYGIIQRITRVSV